MKKKSSKRVIENLSKEEMKNVIGGNQVPATRIKTVVVTAPRC